MNTKFLKQAAKGCTLALFLVGMPVFGQVTLTSDWTGSQEIPDNAPTGVAYNFSLTTPATVIQNVTINLSFLGGYNSDLYVYMTHGSGMAVLLNRVGVSAANPVGYGNTGFSVTLSGDALGDIHNYQSLGASYNGSGQLTGTWAADGRDIDPASTGSAFDSAPRSNLLNTFNNADPNGNWMLFIADRSSGFTSTLTGYSVSVTAVPEPAQMGLVMGGILCLAAIVLKRRNASAKSILPNN